LSRNTTFMLDGISNFEWKLVKNLVNCQYLLFTETGRHSKFGNNLCKIRWEKHHTAFVKLAEGSEIYNFPIYYFVNFYTKILRKTRSDVASPTRWAEPPCPRRHPRSSAPAHPRAPRTALGICARASRGRVRVFPRPPRIPRSLKSPPFSHRVPARGRAGRAGQALGGPLVSRVSPAGAPYHGRCTAALTPGTLRDDGSEPHCPSPGYKWRGRPHQHERRARRSGQHGHRLLRPLRRNQPPFTRP
jgi:hypothetical protein